MPRAMTRLAGSMLALLLAGCVTLSAEPRAVVSASDGRTNATTLSCDAAERALQVARNGSAIAALEARPLRLLTWNIHKEGDAGWQYDLSSFAATTDVLLLQETVLDAQLRGILDDGGLRWVMASSFMYDADDVGVLTASRIAPLASCTQRMLEPLLRIPKSAVISWLPIAGTRQTLAIANIHAINFEISLVAYRAQIEAVGDALAAHQGPIILAGDFNTWSDARERVLAETASRLGLVEVKLAVDNRATFYGRHLDHIFVRGLDVIGAGAIPVESSDHNPMGATLRVR